MIVKFDAAEGSPVKYGVKVMKLPDVPHGELIWIKAKQRNMTVIESLDPNRQYWVDVTAIYELNEIPVKGIAIKSDLVLTAPHSAKIDKIKLSTDDYCGIRVEWEHVEGCKEYEVSVKIRNELEALLLTKELFCEYKCKNEAGCYSVQLRAKNKSGYFGGYSDEEEILLAPRKLTDIKLEFVVEEQREVKQIKASWEMKDDTVDGFYVNEYRENVLQSEGKQEVKESFYIISDTVPSMEYYIEAWAYNFNKAEGPKEKSSRITTEPLQGKIDEVKVDDSKKYMFLIFWESQERCKTHVEFTKDGVGDSELVIYDEKTSSATYKGSFGSRYSVKIRMENKQKLGRWSEAKCIQLVPGKVKEPHLALIEYKLEVSWDLVNGADKYNLKLLSHEDGSIDDSQWKDTLECKYSFEPLKPGMAYQVIISAQNGSGKSEETISKEIRTKWDKPTYFIATPDLENPSAKAVLKWNRPYGVNCCRITVDDQPPKEVKCETQHISYSFLANKPGEECDIRLQCGRDGIYDQSLIAPQTPLIFAPNSPNSVELIAMPEMPSSLFLKIQEPNGAKPYEYKYSLFQGKTLTKGDVLKDLYHKIVGLQPNTEYHATVKCYSRNKDCPSTEVRSVPVKTFPDVLREINRRENNKYIFDIDPPHVSPNYYRIKCVGTDESSHLWEVTEPFFKVENVKSGVDYSITVAAVNVSGEGKYSDSILLRGHVSAPINVQVKNSLSSPTTALEVNFEITDSRAQEHRVMVQGLDLDKQLAPVIATHNSALVQDLIPGGRYQVHVVSVMDGIQSPGSSSKIIQTCPSQVQNLRVESVNFKTRKLLWDSLNPTPGCYKICHWINDETRKDEVLNESPFIIENFKPGYSYFFKVAAVNSSGPGCFSITKEYTENPAPPINLFAQRDSKNPTSAINVQLVEAYTDYPNKPDIYFIRCENVDTKEIVTQQTRSDPVVFEELSPGSLYQFSCRAETNGIPSKEIRAERIVRTALSPPLHIEAQVDRDKPSTQINVVITKANKQAGYYVIILASESDKRELSKRVDEDQVKFDDLKPGETYSIKGHAELHGDEAVTSSTSICDKTVQTYPPVCKRPEKYDERHNQTRFHWEVSAFPVRGYQISFSHDNSEDTYFTTNTYYDHMLECGQEYSVKVAFENNAGIGRFSEPLQFITKPSTPTITCWESKSKKEVLISCTASRRANKYIFKIKPKHLSPDEEELEEIKIPSGKPSLKLPLEHLDCVDYSISVIAANEAGNSDPSPPVWHKHYFNYIQDQMKKQVSKKYNEKQHVSANWENLFGETQEDLNAFLNLNAGQSVMLLGSLGSGKTQACFHYLMKTEFDEMVFYVDKVAFDSWNEISITGLLKELFPKLLRAGNNNRELLKFMDDNSNKLIFVIDNLSLANSNYTGCTYDDKVSVDCLFYNLVKEKRSLFTDSRVVFTSNTKSVYDAMNPTKICQLKGFQKEAIIKSVHRECKFLDHEAVEKAREYLSTPIIHELCTYPPAFTAFIKYMSSENSELTAAGLVSYMLHHEIVKKNELEEKDYSQLKQMWEEVGRVSALIAVKTKHTVELNSTDVYSKILVAMYIVLSQDYESFKLYLAAQCENPNLDPLIFQLVLGFLNANAPITIAKVFSQAEILPSTAVFETKSIKVPSYIKKKKDQINKRIKEGIIPKELWSTCLAELDNDKLSQSFASLNVSG